MLRDYSEEEINGMRNITAEGMTDEEGLYYYKFLHNCKDIINPENIKAEGCVGQIVKLLLIRKNSDEIEFNGDVSYSTPDGVSIENRCISGFISMVDDKIIIETNVIRLLAMDAHNKYTVIDEFSIKNGIVTRKSYYDYQYRKKYTDNVEIEWRGKNK